MNDLPYTSKALMLDSRVPNVLKDVGGTLRKVFPLCSFGAGLFTFIQGSFCASLNQETLLFSKKKIGLLITTTFSIKKMEISFSCILLCQGFGLLNRRGRKSFKIPRFAPGLFWRLLGRLRRPPGFPGVPGPR